DFYKNTFSLSEAAGVLDILNDMRIHRVHCQCYGIIDCSITAAVMLGQNDISDHSTRLTHVDHVRKVAGAPELIRSPTQRADHIANLEWDARVICKCPEMPANIFDMVSL